MNEIIQAFLKSGKVAIAGTSPKRDNFGSKLMVEIEKRGKVVYPLNPLHQEVHRKLCYPNVKELPDDVCNLILAVPPQLCEEITQECIGSKIKRVWMVRGFGDGAYSEKAHTTCKENGIDVVYGFCPLMFYGNGLHRSHLWLRTVFGKLPEEYRLSND